MSHLREVSLVLLALLTAASASASVPDTAWGKAIIGQDAPMWVSEDFAVVEGELQRQHFHPDILVTLEHHLATARDRNEKGCEIFTEPAGWPVLQGTSPAASFRSIESSAAQLVSGEITDAKQGFLYGSPGTLLEVTVDPQATDLEGNPVYVFVRLARLRVDGAYLCSGLVDGRSTPQVGASVVLALDERIDEGRSLGESPSGGQILELKPHEVLIAGALPRVYGSSSLDVDEIRSDMRNAGRRP